MERIESMLKDIGMKEYEAKAFNVTVQCGVCSADRISKTSGIPLTRVYETMQSLQKMGLVTVLNTRPKKYRLVSLDALSNLMESKKRKMERELERSGNIIKELRNIIPKVSARDSDEIREGFWVFKGRETAIRKISDDARNARKDIIYFSDDFSWFARFRKLIKSKIAEGVSVKVLMNVNDKTMSTAKELLSIGVDVRSWDVRSLRGSIRDSETVHLVSKIPRTGVKNGNHYGEAGTDELYMYDTLTTANPIMVNMVKTYFDVFWWRGEKPRI